MDFTRRNLSLLVRITIVIMMVLAGTSALLPREASAAGGATSLITIGPATQTHATGSGFSTTIAVSCAGAIGTTCGPNVKVSIPLTTSTTPPMTEASWHYAATSGTAGFITAGPTIVGDNLVLELSSTDFIAGYSGTLILTVTPPNLITPNNTVWSLRPTIDGDGIVPTKAPAGANSVATAAPLVSLAKTTADGGSVYEVGQPITFNLTAKCSTSTTGNLELEHGSLVDFLPADLTYVSSTPAGAVFDPVQHSVTWSFANGDPASLPKGCHPLAVGPNTYTVTATGPASVPVLQPIRNSATFEGTGADANKDEGITSSTSAQVPINFVLVPGTGPGLGYASIVKSSLAPIPQGGIVTGNQYVGTYPGQWVTPSTSPTFTIGSAAASYRTTVTYGLVGQYETNLVDPVPCLDNSVGNVFTSPTPTEPICSRPAFLTTIFQVTSLGSDPTTNGLGQAYLAGWRPTVTYADGISTAVNATQAIGPTASSAYFAIPAGKAVASVTVPPNALLKNHSLQLTLWGYASAELAHLNGSLNELHNTAVATPQLLTGGPLAPVRASNSLFTLPNIIQLGISKSFGTLGSGAKGTTELKVVGSVNNPFGSLNHDLVITDLLPLGLSWSNPSTSVVATITHAGNRPVTEVASVEYLKNFAGSRRSLIRITVPKAALSSPGAWTVAFPNGFLLLTTPSALGLYPNTDQIFLKYLGSAPLNEVCSTPTQTNGGISTASYQSVDTADLDGDGFTNEAHCQNAATLAVTATGVAFALTKTTQGDLDLLPKAALDIGETGPSGSGVFALNWSNVGSDTLKNAVIYDVLPQVGDTGVSQGQSSVSRDSETAVEFQAASTGAGISIAYSTSLNPCRPEVFANALNATCVNDWSATPPTPLSSVTALRFIGVGPYPKGASFTVSISVKMPTSVVNHVAWNSAASNATDLSNPTTVPLPAEPPKVGLVAPSTPSIQTTTSVTEVDQFDAISDQVTISGTGGAPGTLDWSLVGPVAVVGNSCDSADFSAAPVAGSGTQAIAGDETITIGPVPTGTGGCYSWAYHLTGSAYHYSADQAPGAPGENTLTAPYPPRLSTTASQTFGSDGSVAITDSIQVDSISVGNPTPPTPLSWTLFGPLSPANGSCDGLDWTAAPTAGSGSIGLVAPGNGTYATPPTTVTSPGCYSFGTSLPASAGSLSVSEVAGQKSETVEVLPPTMVTHSSVEHAFPWTQVTDHVTIAGTNGGQGTLGWQLLGPVKSGASGCASADWTTAPVAASGTATIAGDGETMTGPATVSGPGCYSWSDTLTAATNLGFPSPVAHPAGSAHEVITVVSTTPTITTKAEARVDGGSTSFADTVTITGLGNDGQGPLRASYSWTLVGPIAQEHGSCAHLDWSSASIVATGVQQVVGDGTTTTRAVPITAEGCYSFQEELGATENSAEVRSPAGQLSETYYLAVAEPQPKPPLPLTGLNVGKLLLWASLLGAFGLVLLAVARRLRIER